MRLSQFAKRATALIALATARSPGRAHRPRPAAGHRARAWIAVTAALLLGALGLTAAATAAPALAATPTPLSITTTTPLTATAGSAFLAKLDATGGTKPYTWSLAGGTTLPAGLVLHAATGQISGTPTGPGGTFGFTAQVTDNEATPVSVTAAESITVTVNPLAVTTVSLPAATAGVAYSTTLTATGGVTPYSWSMPVGLLPAGLTLHPSGVISGTPKAGGTFTFTAVVTDSETTPQTASAPESLTVGVAGLVVTTGSTLPTVTSGVPYSVKLAAAGGITPYTWSLAAGPLPAGLTLKASGTLSGTTAVTGLDTITVQVSDAENPAVTATEILSLYVATPMTVPTALPGANLDEPYDTSLQPSGGLGPYTYAISAGSLPPGLALQSDGEITGEATADGTSAFTVSVTDSENPPATVLQAESIIVTGTPIVFVATDGSDANAGTATAPLQTIGAAITLADQYVNPVIDVAGGSYNEGAGISLISDLTINGGYSEGAWTQTSAQPTTIIGSPQAALADGVTGVSLDDVTLAPALPGAAGSSVYGLRAVNGSSVALTDVTIDTPSAAPGLPGAIGTAGATGTSGQNGTDGAGCPPPSGPTPGVGGAGGTGPNAGGAGGSGGVEFNGLCGANGASGGAGAGPHGGSAGSLGDGEAGEPGFSGGGGGNGGNGANGAPGSASFFSPGAASTTWAGLPGNSGLAGQSGSGGGGGGGGGGEGCSGLCFNPLGTGGGGGGGGAGGSGGSPGAGGGAGGGAFGIYLWSSSVSLVATTVQVGNGGAGGAGGNGGPGGYGGGGAGGGAGGNNYAGGSGGSGGNGGNGGAGGAGSGGTGGPSIGIFAGSGSTETVDGASVITVGSGGAGGSGGTVPVPAPVGGTGLATAVY